MPVEYLRVSPNPFVDSVVLEIASSSERGSVLVLDLSGRTVASLPFRTREGHAQVFWDSASEGSAVPPGVYIMMIDGSDAPPVRLARVR